MFDPITTISCTKHKNAIRVVCIMVQVFFNYHEGMALKCFDVSGTSQLISSAHKLGNKIK